MTRRFHIDGEVLVRIQFGAGVAPFDVITKTPVPLAPPPSGGSADGNTFELGLAKDSVSIELHSKYDDVLVNDFGNKVPADVLWNLADATIRMSLIHYDQGVLDSCMAESFGGAFNPKNPLSPFQATTSPEFLPGAGAPLGNALPLGFRGNHYQSLCMSSPRENFPWTFPASYLAEQPLIYPMGTMLKVAKLTWRAIPYPSAIFLSGTSVILSGNIQILTPPEITSSGAVLFNHILN